MGVLLGELCTWQRGEDLRFSRNLWDSCSTLLNPAGFGCAEVQFQVGHVRLYLSPSEGKLGHRLATLGRSTTTVAMPPLVTIPLRAPSQSDSSAPNQQYLAEPIKDQG